MPEMVALRALDFLPQARRIVGSGDENGLESSTLIGGESSRHYGIPAPLKYLKQDRDILVRKIKIFFLT